MTLIETIDKIKTLRAEADAMLERDTYDPCGYTQKEADELRKHADEMEADMEARLGWRKA